MRVPRAKIVLRHCVSAFIGRFRRVGAMMTTRQLSEVGASTAEYAMTMVAACGFAGVLLAIIRSSPIKTLLVNIIQKAMSIG